MYIHTPIHTYNHTHSLMFKLVILLNLASDLMFFQMLMNVLLVLTTVNNCVPTLQEVLPVDVTLDMSCWLMAMSVKVLLHGNTHTLTYKNTK